MANNNTDIEALKGTWNYVSNENFDAFLKEMGINKVLRTLAKTVKPRVVIAEKDGKWSFRSETTLKTTAIEFIPGVEFTDVSHDGEPYTSTVRFENGKWTQTIHYSKSGKQLSVQRWVDNQDQLQVTMECGNVKATELYKRARQLPYESIEDENEVRRRKINGEILSQPENCDEALWNIIVRCWHQGPEARPTFKILKELLLELQSRSIFAMLRQPSTEILVPPLQRIFQDIEQFLHYIVRTSEIDRLTLIVSDQLGQEIVPHIHELRQVISIYVYCMDKNSNEQWVHKFAKIKSVVVDLDELVSQITADHKIQKKVEEPSSINIFSTSVGAGKSTTGVNGQFVFFQILVDCLLRLKSTEIDKNELINCWQNEYEGNNTELNNLREFEKDYSPDEVLWWYTKNTFFYRTLNAALRTQNIHMIFLFRSFIYDIYCQLQKSQSEHPLKVYRGQIMSNDELNSLKQNIGQFISVNSFLSTTDERSVALFYLGDITTKIDSERVLFEIDADPNIVSTKPFAYIGQNSGYMDDSEVLFMSGSIFRLNNIHRNGDQVWIIKMTLCNDDEHDLKQVLMHMKQQIGNEETNLRTLGKLLWEMGEFDLAEKYLTRSLKELPPNDPLHIRLYEDLGILASQRVDYDASVKWRQKLLTFKEQNKLTTDSNIDEANKSTGIAASSSVFDFQCESQPVLYFTDFELSSLMLHPDTTHVITYNMDKQSIEAIAELNPQYPFYIISSETVPPRLISNPLLIQYYYVSTSMADAGKTLTTLDRVTNIDSIERFSSELYTDLAEYYRNKAFHALNKNHDRDEIKSLLRKSKKCLEMLKYVIEGFAVNSETSQHVS
ncbi:unnamed protein product [Adineta steineri]|uniref:Serine-threonine/tyrosine-protein kinase catalytic domain-containing protein n=1 Tax=Adineta steineri TaxID=433720 RepID=A0A813V7Y1_9BILA|nr:unnamed protein product [Adineta steineri]